MPTFKLKTLFRGWAMSMPWLTLIALPFFFKLGLTEITKDSLIYAAYKVNVAIVLAMAADWVTNWSSPPSIEAEGGNYLPQIRRSLYFIGACWILSVA